MYRENNSSRNAFVAEVLGEAEDDIQQFISTYSARFNSPESGKYQLYHERLKVYLLQKFSENEIHLLHEKLITRLEKAILDQKSDEFDLYGQINELFYITIKHGANRKMQRQKLQAYSQTHWARQLKISKGYYWTKNGLKEVMATCCFFDFTHFEYIVWFAPKLMVSTLISSI